MKSRPLTIEPLEARQLLSVTPDFLAHDDSEALGIVSQGAFQRRITTERLKVNHTDGASDFDYTAQSSVAISGWAWGDIIYEMHVGAHIGQVNIEGEIVNGTEASAEGTSREAFASLFISGTGMVAVRGQLAADTSMRHEFACCGSYISTDVETESSHAYFYAYARGVFNIDLYTETGFDDWRIGRLTVDNGGNISAPVIEHGKASASVDIDSSGFHLAGSSLSSIVHYGFTYGSAGDLVLGETHAQSNIRATAVGFGKTMASTLSESSDTWGSIRSADGRSLDFLHDSVRAEACYVPSQTNFGRYTRMSTAASLPGREDVNERSRRPGSLVAELRRPTSSPPEVVDRVFAAADLLEELFIH